MARRSWIIPALAAGCLLAGHAGAETILLDCTAEKTETTSASGSSASSWAHETIAWEINDRSVIENGNSSGSMTVSIGDKYISWERLVRPTTPGSSAAQAMKFSVKIDRTDGTFTKTVENLGPQGVASKQIITGSCTKAEPRSKKF